MPLRLPLQQKTKVQINGDRGRQPPLGQGLPQGSVLVPLLILLYIGGLLAGRTRNVEFTMFADDASLFSSHTNIEVAEANVQEAVMKAAPQAYPQRQQVRGCH